MDGGDSGDRDGNRGPQARHGGVTGAVVGEVGWGWQWWR